MKLVTIGEKPKQLVTIWLALALALAKAEGIQEKKAKSFSFIHPSAWKSTGFLGHNDTAAMNQTHSLTVGTRPSICVDTRGYPHCHQHKTVNMMTHFRIKDAFTLQNAHNEIKVVRSSLYIQCRLWNKLSFFVWPCHRFFFFFFCCLLIFWKAILCVFLQGNHWMTSLGFPCVLRLCILLSPAWCPCSTLSFVIKIFNLSLASVFILWVCISALA